MIDPSSDPAIQAFSDATNIEGGALRGRKNTLLALKNAIVEDADVAAANDRFVALLGAALAGLDGAPFYSALPSLLLAANAAVAIEADPTTDADILAFATAVDAEVTRVLERRSAILDMRSNVLSGDTDSTFADLANADFVTMFSFAAEDAGAFYASISGLLTAALAAVAGIVGGP